VRLRLGMISQVAFEGGRKQVGCRRIIAAVHFIKRDLVTRVGVSDWGKARISKSSILGWMEGDFVLNSRFRRNPPFSE
jgi:hypothetical protein